MVLCRANYYSCGLGITTKYYNMDKVIVSAKLQMYLFIFLVCLLLLLLSSSLLLY